jgi:hypothetical protein
MGQWCVINRIPAATGCPPLKTTQLGNKARMIQQ